MKRQGPITFNLDGCSDDIFYDIANVVHALPLSKPQAFAEDNSNITQNTKFKICVSQGKKNCERR